MKKKKNTSEFVEFIAAVSEEICCSHKISTENVFVLLVNYVGETHLLSSTHHFQSLVSIYISSSYTKFVLT